MRKIELDALYPRRLSGAGSVRRPPRPGLARNRRRGDDFETVIRDLLDGQYNSFNTTEGWSRDVSEDVARELQQRCTDEMRELPTSLEDFVELVRRSGA